MSIFKLHRWLFSLTLVVSLISFSGISAQNSPVIINTEFVVLNNYTTYDDVINFHVQTVLEVPTLNFIDFNFQQFLQTQNKRFSQKEKDQDLTVMKIENKSFYTISILLVSIPTKNYSNIFLG